MKELIELLEGQLRAQSFLLLDQEQATQFIYWLKVASSTLEQQTTLLKAIETYLRENDSSSTEPNNA